MQERGNITGQYSYGAIRAGYKIFTTAIMISLIVHLIWLSMIKVVITPNRTTPVRFSRVSFVGTLLSKGAKTSLTAQPKEQTFLGKRYMAKIGMGPKGGSLAEKAAYAIYEGSGGESHTLSDQNLKVLIETAMGDKKIEPLTP